MDRDLQTGPRASVLGARISPSHGLGTTQPRANLRLSTVFSSDPVEISSPPPSLSSPPSCPTCYAPSSPPRFDGDGADADGEYTIYPEDNDEEMGYDDTDADSEYNMFFSEDDEEMDEEEESRDESSSSPSSSVETEYPTGRGLEHLNPIVRQTIHLIETIMERASWDIGRMLMAYTRNGKRAVRVKALQRAFRCNSKLQKMLLDGLDDNSLAEYVSWRARREWRAVAGQEFFGRAEPITSVDELSPKHAFVKL